MRLCDKNPRVNPLHTHTLFPQDHKKSIYPEINLHMHFAGADPGFDQGGAPDHDRPKTAILGPQFCRILVLGPHFWWSGGARGPPWIRPCFAKSTVFCLKLGNHTDFSVAI